MASSAGSGSLIAEQWYHIVRWCTGGTTMDATLEKKVQLLIDHQEIEQVLKLYCRAIDRLDVELLKSIYHPDGTDDHGSFVGNAQEFAVRIMSDLKELILDGMHTVTHCAIE